MLFTLPGVTPVSDDDLSERRPGNGDPDTDDETDPSGPTNGLSPDDDTTSDGSPGTTGSSGTSPFDELDPEVGSGTGDVDGLFEEVFTEAETDELDTEAVWDELEGTDEKTVRDEPVEAGSDGATDGEAIWDKLEETASEGHDRDLDGTEHVVQTSSFCEQCVYVDDPPEARCTYDGSEIVEFVDEDHVRVKNCPIVARREGIGEVD